MKIVADKDIPFVEHYFSSAGDLVLVPGRTLTQNDLQEAEVLLVRSITKVNKELLQGTKVKFVASPTTGDDHYDKEWLANAGIAWSVAPGCNAIAVAEYVICAIAALQKRGYLTGRNLRAGVVGVGKIGSRVAEKLKILGFDVVLCDPLRALNERDFVTTPLEEFAEFDFITLHTPLTRNGLFPTYHMIDKTFLARQKKNCILMNTGRGSVIDFNDLKVSGEQLIWCLDVWENEPLIDFTVLDTALIATPHIAGYTVQSKYRGIEMMYHASLKQGFLPDKNISVLSYPEDKITFNHQKADWRDVVLKIFDPFKLSTLMKDKMIENEAGAFDGLRKSFVDRADRHEFKFVELKDVQLSSGDQVMWNQLTLMRA